MTDPCCSGSCASSAAPSPRFRRALWIALAVNAAMFAVEISGSIASGSVSLMADAVDFLGDAFNYGISLAVLSLGIAWRARAAAIKGLTMASYGVAVLAVAVVRAVQGEPPEPVTMGAIALLALAANLGVAAMLYAFREGDANMRSVWLCSRNDAIGNLAVIAAALAVAGLHSPWPDLAVAALMAVLGLHSGIAIVRQARSELRIPAPIGPDTA